MVNEWGVSDEERHDGIYVTTGSGKIRQYPLMPHQ